MDFLSQLSIQVWGSRSARFGRSVGEVFRDPPGKKVWEGLGSRGFFCCQVGVVGFVGQAMAPCVRAAARL